MATFISVGTGNTPPHRKHRHSQSDFGRPILSPHFASLSPTTNPNFKHSLGMSMFVFTCLELLHSLGMLFKCFGVHVTKAGLSQLSFPFVRSIRGGSSTPPWGGLRGVRGSIPAWSGLG